MRRLIWNPLAFTLEEGTAEGNVVDGKREGEWNFYHEKGGLDETDHYLNGVEIQR